MIYVFPIAIPKSTPQANPVKQVLALSRGKITRVMVHFPSGHLGLTHLGLNRGLYQLYPSNPEARFSSSGETIQWDEEYELDAEPFQLEAYGWNDDDTYDHTITVRVVIQALAEQTSLVDEIKKLFTG